MSIKSFAFGSRYRFTYVNHKGEREVRNVRPEGLSFGEVKGYYETPTWLLTCWDYDRDAYRSFDLSKIELDTYEKVDP